MVVNKKRASGLYHTPKITGCCFLPDLTWLSYWTLYRTCPKLNTFSKQYGFRKSLMTFKKQGRKNSTSAVFSK